MTPRTAIAVSALFLATGCGVPQATHDQAVRDARDAQSQLQKNQEEVDRLRAALRQAEANATSEDTKAELEELRQQKASAEARLKLFEQFLQKFKTMIDAGRLEIAVRRGQIVLVLGTDVLFDEGKTEIKPEGKTALAEIAGTLRTLRGRRFQVAGHSDSTPIKTKEFPSNWDLSSARALEVVRLLIARGVSASTLSAAGYGEHDPVAANSNAANRAKNRRIEITLQPNIEELIALPALKKP